MTIIRTLVISSLYPNPVQPRHGIFIEQRLRHLVATGRVEATVVAPVPWFPSRHRAFGRYAVLARVPRYETRHGIEVFHPRYPVIPKLGMALTPRLMAAALRREVGGLLARGYAFDVFDGYYLYPDGVCTTRLARVFGRPSVITALGSDVNIIPDFAGPRAQIVAAAREAAAVTTVAEALAERLSALGVAREHITVVRHGVDLELFRPHERAALRAELGLAGPTLISVGNLIALKGHDICIRALASLPETTLLIAGAGEQEQALRALADELGLAGRVRFLGLVAHEEMSRYMAAADALVLASSHEGIANVLVEAMACGTPVVATAVGGTAEVVNAPAAGVLMRERTPAACAEAVRTLLANPPDRAATRRHAEAFTWEATNEGHLAVLERALAAPAPIRAS